MIISDTCKVRVAFEPQQAEKLALMRSGKLSRQLGLERVHGSSSGAFEQVGSSG